MYNNELYHHGIKGMKWGRRRYQNEDGSYKAGHEGRYDSDGSSQKTSMKQMKKDYKSASKQAKADYKAAKKAYRQTEEGKAEAAARRKKAIKVGAAVAATALAAYGAYKLNQYVKTKNCEIAAQKGFEHAKKSFDRSVSEIMKSGTGLDKAVSGTYEIRSNSGAKAIARAREASNQNFRTAAKNVIDYKRSGKSLRNLTTVNSYKGMDDVIKWKK